MSQCKRPCTIALSAPGRFTYLFGDLDPETHAADVLAVAVSYSNSETGFLTRPARPEVLRAGILGRIPPENHESDLIEPLIQ
jgi:predicted metal-binding protein